MPPWSLCCPLARVGSRGAARLFFCSQCFAGVLLVGSRVCATLGAHGLLPLSFCFLVIMCCRVCCHGWLMACWMQKKWATVLWCFCFLWCFVWPRMFVMVRAPALFLKCISCKWYCDVVGFVYGVGVCTSKCAVCAQDLQLAWVWVQLSSGMGWNVCVWGVVWWRLCWKHQGFEMRAFVLFTVLHSSSQFFTSSQPPLPCTRLGCCAIGATPLDTQTVAPRQAAATVCELAIVSRQNKQTPLCVDGAPRTVPSATPRCVSQLSFVTVPKR